MLRTLRILVIHSLPRHAILAELLLIAQEILLTATMQALDPFLISSLRIRLLVSLQKIRLSNLLLLRLLRMHLSQLIRKLKPQNLFADLAETALFPPTSFLTPTVATLLV
jgi:hypothetical protein